MSARKTRRVELRPGDVVMTAAHLNRVRRYIDEAAKLREQRDALTGTGRHDEWERLHHAAEYVDVELAGYISAWLAAQESAARDGDR